MLLLLVIVLLNNGRDILNIFGIDIFLKKLIFITFFKIFALYFKEGLNMLNIICLKTGISIDFGILILRRI